MEYDILYLIRGNASEYQQSKVKELAERFNETYLLEKQRPAHVTLKYRFKTKQIGDVEAILEKITKHSKAPQAKIRGYITFHDRVICLKVNFSREANQLYDTLRRELSKLPWMEWKDEDQIKGKFHSALIYTGSLRNFKRAQAYLETTPPKLDLLIDNVVIRKRQRENTKWSIHKVYELRSK